MAHSLAPATRQQYTTNWQRCLDFIAQELGQTPHPPLTQEQLHLYITHLHSQLKYKHSTILTHLSAISHYHKIKQLPDPTTSYPTTKLLNGVRNLQGPTADTRRPITRTILQGILQALKVCVSKQYDIPLYTSLFTFMYYGFLRASEVLQTDSPQHILQMDNLNYHITTNSYKVTFHHNKHSSFQPTHITLSPTGHSDCPVTALKMYVSQRGSRSGPIYLRNGLPLNRNTVLHQLHACLRYLNIPTTHYNLHSFRIGRTTDLAAANIQPNTIRQLGRWKSNAYIKYIRPLNISTSPQTDMQLGQPSSC